MANLNLRGVDSGIRNGVIKRLSKHVEYFESLARPIAGEISLTATENVDVTGH
jgi:hypothetical protein